jgi:hypothetical protein
VAWPLAPPKICPRDPLGGAALGEMNRPVDESVDLNLTPERMARMNRSPGGRSKVIYVRVTEEEDREIRRRAVKHRRSAQRFLIETALSGSARLSAERSRAQRDAEMARIVLTRLANNVNQLAKWANTNHTLPDTFTDVFGDVRQATAIVAEATRRLQTGFEQNR